MTVTVPPRDWPLSLGSAGSVPVACLPLPNLDPFHSRLADCVLPAEEEEDSQPGEQPELLEQRHHHGLLQQARSGVTQGDPVP